MLFGEGIVGTRLRIFFWGLWYGRFEVELMGDIEWRGWGLKLWLGEVLVMLFFVSVRFFREDLWRDLMRDLGRVVIIRLDMF